MDFVVISDGEMQCQGLMILLRVKQTDLVRQNKIRGKGCTANNMSPYHRTLAAV
jgi:hypothetical protein